MDNNLKVDIYKEINNKVKEVDPLFFKENRLATFKTWIFKSNKQCSAKNLADAGFIFYGTKQDPDTVKCFFCDKTLDGWEESDIPWDEHESHAPHCAYAKLRTSDLTLFEYLTLRNQLTIRIKNKVAEKLHEEIKEFLDDMEDEMDMEMEVM